MKKAFRVVQFASNIGILVLTVLAVFAAIRLYVTTEPKSPQAGINSRRENNSEKQTLTKTAPENILGKTVPLDAINWKNNGTTLILYLSTTCRYCNESIPFYQRLKKEWPKSVPKVVALFLQDDDEATKYLDSKSLIVDGVVSGSLRSIGITGTPTLLLVDENGVVTDIWRGKLSSEKENEVIAKLVS
ncbi:MAG: TlpA family protein disulfide reductase [Pyrinomonadaceae bacterium]